MKPSLQFLLIVCCGLQLKPTEALPSSCVARLYPTELDAVRAAADLYNPLSIREDREYIGAIFETEGKYSFSVSAAGRRNDNWSLAIPGVEWDSVRAIWHTHGDDSPHNRYFSDSDTRSVKKFGLPFYLADYTGYLKIFNTGDKTLSPIAASRLSLPRRPGYAIGEYLRDEQGRPIRVKVREARQRLHS